MARPALTCIMLGAALAPGRVARAQATFSGVGVPDGALLTDASCVSADGRLTFGVLQLAPSSSPLPAFCWQSQSGLAVIDPPAAPPPDLPWVVVHAGSATGDVVAGTALGPCRDDQAVYWTAAEGWVNIPLPPGWPICYSGATAITADGDTIIGHMLWQVPSGQQAGVFRWSRTTGMTLLGPGWIERGASADGRVIVGASSGQSVWYSDQGGFTTLLPLPGAGAGSVAAVSPDGTVAAGYCIVGGHRVGVTWTSSGQVRPLPTLPGPTEFEPHAVSAGGGVIAGVAYTPIPGNRIAAVWTRAGGAIDLLAYLSSIGVPVGDWSQASAAGVSADGRVIVGGGRHQLPQGARWEAWVATLPEGFGCYPNCDQSTAVPVLSVADFACFLNRLASGDPYANCDNSTTPPALNVLDFVCFLDRFAAGCP